jgi:diacylglycerol kinase family enzyme
MSRIVGETVNSRAPIPALVNARSGSASRALSALRLDTRFAIRELAPREIAEAVRGEASKRTARILICGGDGTVATALGAAAGTALDVAVFPGGTLNHFARDAGLPINDPTAVLDIAATGSSTLVDLGYVNGHVILNTSSVGSYVDFVRSRETARRWLGYRMSSLVAAIRVWLRPRSVIAEIHSNEGTNHLFQTPLLFVGVDERTLGRSGLGARVAGGARSFHVLVVKDRTRSRLAAVAFGALARGLDEFLRDDEVEAHLVSEIIVNMQHTAGIIAIDGELIPVTSPLHFEFKRAVTKVIWGK